jgi:hypothetical protein
MKKALNHEKNIIYSIRNGIFRGHALNKIDELIDVANHASAYEVIEKKGGEVLKKDGVPLSDAEMPKISDKMVFCILVKKWMCSLVNNKGVTERLTFDLNYIMEEIRYIQRLMPTSAGSVRWLPITDMDRGLTVVESAGFAFSQQLAIGTLEDLRRCQSSKCQKFFIGRPNAKWCSKSCGSYSRVQKKRKRDMQ